MVALVTVLVLVVNILFGYWRSNTRKLSAAWMVAVHGPVPVAIGLRVGLLGWSWKLLPVFVFAFAAGQYLGGRWRRFLAARTRSPLSSFLVVDVIRMARPKSPRRQSTPPRRAGASSSTRAK